MCLECFSSCYCEAYVLSVSMFFYGFKCMQIDTDKLSNSLCQRWCKHVFHGLGLFQKSVGWSGEILEPEHQNKPCISTHNIDITACFKGDDEWPHI